MVEEQTDVTDVPAGVQHVGHEGDGVGAARRVHHVDHDTGERGGLRDQTVRWGEEVDSGAAGEGGRRRGLRAGRACCSLLEPL